MSYIAPNSGNQLYIINQVVESEVNYTSTPLTTGSTFTGNGGYDFLLVKNS